jgi:hypothetical protein
MARKTSNDTLAHDPKNIKEGDVTNWFDLVQFDDKGNATRVDSELAEAVAEAFRSIGDMTRQTEEAASKVAILSASIRAMRYVKDELHVHIDDELLVCACAAESFKTRKGNKGDVALAAELRKANATAEQLIVRPQVRGWLNRTAGGDNLYKQIALGETKYDKSIHAKEYANVAQVYKNQLSLARKFCYFQPFNDYLIEVAARSPKDYVYGGWNGIMKLLAVVRKEIEETVNKQSKTVPLAVAADMLREEGDKPTVKADKVTGWEAVNQAMARLQKAVAEVTKLLNDNEGSFCNHGHADLWVQLRGELGDLKEFPKDRVIGELRKGDAPKGDDKTEEQRKLDALNEADRKENEEG